MTNLRFLRLTSWNFLFSHLHFNVFYDGIHAQFRFALVLNSITTDFVETVSVVWYAYPLQCMARWATGATVRFYMNLYKKLRMVYCGIVVKIATTFGADNIPYKFIFKLPFQTISYCFSGVTCCESTSQIESKYGI